MGKGRVLSAHGEGRYTIEIVEDRARAESARALAVQRVSELDGRISNLDQQIGAAQADVDAAAAAQNAAIEQYRLDMAETGESDIDLGAWAQAVLDAAADRDRLRTQQRLLETQRAAAQSRIDRIDALPPLRQIEAWCADYTEDLAGEVATAEIPGEIGQVIIKAGFEDGAAWSPVVDGAIQPALAGTPAGVFYNLAMLPGWQKWRPTFRIATISNIDNDLCDIALDPATSSQQGLNVNAQGSYTGVPIMYMDCNGDAFEDGDRVLVAFSGSTGQPMVVGFEQEPKACDLDAVLVFIFNVSPNQLFEVSNKLEQLFFEVRERYPGFLLVLYYYTEGYDNDTGLAFHQRYLYRDLESGVFFDAYDSMMSVSGGGWSTTHRYLISESSVERIDDLVSFRNIPHNRVHVFHFSRYYQVWDPYDENPTSGHNNVRLNTLYLDERYGVTQFGYPSPQRDFTLQDFGGELGHYGEVTDSEVYSEIWKVVEDKELNKAPSNIEGQ
ncbi:MAG: hypothetical protein ACQEUG_16045 [Pseudomonadota bacterium]